MPLIDSNGVQVSNTKSANFNPADNTWLVDGGIELANSGYTFVDPAPNVSVTTFLLLFTSTERVAIRAAVATDPIIADWWAVLNDPRTTTVDLNLAVIGQALDYLIFKTLLTTGRKAEILTGTLK